MNKHPFIMAAVSGRVVPTYNGEKCPKCKFGWLEEVTIEGEKILACDECKTKKIILE